MNYKYARLVNNHVTKIVDVEYPIEEPGWMEITNANPQPSIHWGYDNVSGLFYPATEMIINLIVAKEKAREEIDHAAGQARLRFTTEIPGQPEVYREKYDQAVDFLTTEEQVSYADYPLLEVESKILDIPMKDIAENIVKTRSKWITKISTIEGLRLSGKYNLDDCTTIQEVSRIKIYTINKLNQVR